ncbi:hypothetical protein DFH07DRAFT_797896 [Mycena maculata]|uniref:N-acetyltransferase domain-containing protein n=1 Tax=Mycena maculata TaxID=230809 RepID=A0AAD7NVK8_9AGAR|nr:hypothetical protein DFH07DRAFT_797896 [Mycena maculata]
MPQFTYSTHTLPCPRTTPSPPPDLAVIAQKYATARLEALLASPNAFASTHAIESIFTPEEWAKKIWREDAVVLVCVARPDFEVGPLDGEWVGCAILRGPLPAREYALPPEAAAPAAGRDDAETKWQMTGVFVSVAHRGRGIGKMLIQAGKDYAVAQTQADPPLSRVRLRVMIHPDNLLVLSLYSKAGFVDAGGRATGQEAYRTNGDESLFALKLNSLSEEMKMYWTTARVAIVLEWLGEARP